MILYGIRLLVALLTFTAGAGAAWLFDAKPSPARPDMLRNCSSGRR